MSQSLAWSRGSAWKPIPPSPARARSWPPEELDFNVHAYPKYHHVLESATAPEIGHACGATGGDAGGSELLNALNLKYRSRRAEPSWLYRVWRLFSLAYHGWCRFPPTVEPRMVKLCRCWQSQKFPCAAGTALARARVTEFSSITLNANVVHTAWKYIAGKTHGQVAVVVVYSFPAERSRHGLRGPPQLLQF